MRARQRRETWGQDRGLALGLTVVAGVVLAAMAIGLDRVSLEVLSGGATLLALGLVGALSLAWVARREGQQAIVRLLLVAFAAKLAFSVIRYVFMSLAYGTVGDSAAYTTGGRVIADMIRDGDFSFLTDSVLSGSMETQRIAIVVALIYLVTGVSRYAAIFVFTSVCFAGQVLMWRSFRRAVPDGDSDVYARLVFFLPSMLFWPSTVGKDALMVGCIGLTSWGAAQLLGSRVSFAGLVSFVAGVAGLMAVRPHMSLIAIVALAVGATVGSVEGMRRAGPSRSAVVRLAALILLVALGSVGVTQLGKFFGRSTGSDVGVVEALEQTRERTSGGGSGFDAVTVSSPIDLPAAAVTVLVRPFPWEARNVTSMLSAAEGVIFLGLAWLARRRIATWFRTVLKNPYLVYCAAYALVFIVLFSYIGNFGILARQRTQMLPLVLVGFAMPPWPKTDRRRRRRDVVRRRGSVDWVVRGVAGGGDSIENGDSGPAVETAGRQ